MISLDKKILDSNSAVAWRMIEYGKMDELFILIPFQEEKRFDLSPNVHVFATGGNKPTQYWRLKKMGSAIIAGNKIEEITTQDPFFIGRVGVWLKKKTGAKLEVQLHGDFYSSDYYKKSGVKHWLQYYIGQRVILWADRVRVVGERIRVSLLPLGVPEEKIVVRPVTVDVERIRRYQPTDDLHTKYSAFNKIFLVLGRLDPVKNIGWLINLWADVPAEYLFLIVGGGSERRRLQTQAQARDNLRFETWTEDPVSYIKTADGVLFPSLSEGYGLVPMEAAAAGTPVIMNDVGVANYELKPSEKVKIIPLSDRQGWIQAIKSI